MKTIMPLVLHRTVSGNVGFAPQRFRRFQKSEPEPAAGLQRATADDGKRLVFVSPLPGRWIRLAGGAAALALLLVTGLARAGSDSSAMSAANDAFAQGHYAEAAQRCEAIIAQHGYSAPVLFNLANAQLRAGQLGKAILNYERAALLGPNDPGIAVNLQAARQKAGTELEPQSLSQQIAHSLTMNTWLSLAMLSLFLFATTWPLKLMRPRVRRTLDIGRAVAALALMMAVGAVALRSLELNHAVIMTPEAVAGISPVTAAAPLFKLRAGEIVTLQRTHGGFALVRNHAGNEGWIKTDELELIMPPVTSQKG